MQLPYHQREPERKLLACDHCSAHGLRCDQGSVCYQCRFYEQPCVHRWCPQSPTSQDDCRTPNCHYAHLDSIPHLENEPKWLIFAGDLPQRAERCPLRSMWAPESGTVPKSMDVLELVNERQRDCAKDFLQGGGKATYTGYYVQCSCETK